HRAGKPHRPSQLKGHEGPEEVSMLRIQHPALTAGLAVTLSALAPFVHAQALPGAGPVPGPAGAMPGAPPAAMMGMGMALGPGHGSPLMSLLAPSVQKELKLKDEQKSKVYTFKRANEQRIRELMQTMAFGGGGGNPQAMMQAGLQIRQETEQGIAQILDA